MTNVTNLRQARKAADRIRKRDEAAENAALHGRSKAQRVLEAAQTDRARIMLDQHRIGGDTDENEPQ